MATQNFARKLTAILTADVKEYSRLMGEDGMETVRTITAYREAMSKLIQNHHGRVVDSPGDNVLSEFTSVVDAVQCAVEIQKDFKTKNAELPENRRMEFRIGINIGEVIQDGERIYGDGVNIAARVEGLAEGGGICITRNVYDQVRNQLTLGYEYIGEQAVKNITEPVAVYRILMAPEDAGKVIIVDQERKESFPLEWKDRPVKYLRDKVVDQLKYNLVHSHLEFDEFEQLARIAINTQSKTELLSLIEDLPVKDTTESTKQELVPYSEEESIINILSSTKRKGAWSPPKHLKVTTVLGESALDFREVKLGPELRYISIGCCLGSVKIVIPQGVNVVSNVKNILGDVKVISLNQGRIDPDSPTIVINGQVILGDVKIIAKGKEIPKKKRFWLINR